MINKYSINKYLFIKFHARADGYIIIIFLVVPIYWRNVLLPNFYLHFISLYR